MKMTVLEALRAGIAHALKNDPDVLVLDLGIWGARGKRNRATNVLDDFLRGQLAAKGFLPLAALPLMTPEEEITEYISWLRCTFPKTALVWVFGGSPYGACASVNYLRWIRGLGGPRSSAVGYK